MNHTTTLHENAYHHRSGHSAGIGHHVLARWPSVVGLLALLANTAGGIDSHVTAMVIILAAMCYLAAAALGSAITAWLNAGVPIKTAQAWSGHRTASVLLDTYLGVMRHDETLGRRRIEQMLRLVRAA